MNEKQQFLTEFKALLEKYDVAIAAPYGETSGSHGKCIEVFERKTGETWMSVQDWILNFRDFKAE